MLSSIVLVVAALSATVLAKPAVDTPLAKPLGETLLPVVDYGNVNLIVDAALFKINRGLPKDPIPFPDPGTALNLHDCFFLGINNGLHRSSDATLSTVAGANGYTQMKFVTAMKMTDLGAMGKWHWGILFGDFVGLSEEIELSTSIGIVMKTGQHPYLTEFHVTTLAPIKMDVSGAPLLNWEAENLIENAINGLGDALTHVVEYQVRAAIQSILDEMIVP